MCDQRETLKEKLKLDIKHWTHAQLVIAFEYCESMCKDVGGEDLQWWTDLRESVRAEIVAKGGRTP